MAEKKSKKISPKILERVEQMINAEPIFSSAENAAQTSISSNVESENAIQSGSSQIGTSTREKSSADLVSIEVLSRQLDEANEAFLKVSEKLHGLEEENSRLVAENNVLKTRCSELEAEKTSLENDLFNSNVEISEKLSRIVELENRIVSIGNGRISSSDLGTVKMPGKPIAGMNGYESWN